MLRAGAPDPPRWVKPEFYGRWPCGSRGEPSRSRVVNPPAVACLAGPPRTHDAEKTKHAFETTVEHLGPAEPDWNIAGIDENGGLAEHRPNRPRDFVGEGTSIGAPIADEDLLHPRAVVIAVEGTFQSSAMPLPLNGFNSDSGVEPSLTTFRQASKRMGSETDPFSARGRVS